MALQKKVRKSFEDPNEVRYQFENEGQVLTGYYVGREEFTANGDELTKHKVKPTDTEAKTISFLGNSVLNDLLTDEDVGTWIEITCLGKKTSKNGRRYMNFDVASDPDKRITA